MSASTNWAGNYTYGAARLLVPTSVDEVREIAASSPALRVLGSRHSFNDIADTSGDQVSLAGLDPQISIDSTARTVSFSGGVRYGELAKALDSAGWALSNLASLPHISVAGAVATGTHGSGDRNGTLPTQVVALELATSSGESVTLRSQDDDFAGAVVGLGALGVVTRLELEIEPTFRMSQHAFEGLSWEAVAAHFDEITSAGYSVSLFTGWDEHGVRLALVKSRLDKSDREISPSAVQVEALSDLFGALPAPDHRHPLPGLPGDTVTEQLGIPGAWHQRMPHFKLDFTPSNGEEIQSEYLVDRVHALEAIDALRALGHHISPILLTGEIRTMKADDLWLSPAYGHDTVGFHFTWMRDQARLDGVLPLIEEALAPFKARPHWEKVSTSTGPELAALYPRMGDFSALVRRLDPRGAFENAYTRRLLG